MYPDSSNLQISPYIFALTVFYWHLVSQPFYANPANECAPMKRNYKPKRRGNDYRALMAYHDAVFKRKKLEILAYLMPSRSMRLRSSLRARRTAAAFSRARFSLGFS